MKVLYLCMFYFILFLLFYAATPSPMYIIVQEVSHMQLKQYMKYVRCYKMFITQAISIFNLKVVSYERALIPGPNGRVKFF